jgi:hypothetical protein
MFNTFYGITSEDVTSVEPFFSYTSATSELRLDYPLDTARLGRQFPPVIQDYQVDITRDWSKLLGKGFIHDKNCKLIVTTRDLTYSTIREMDSFQQQDKSVSNISEVTHTINKYEATYTRGETPEIEISTRQGHFEYAFLYVDFTHTDEPVLPTTSPIISSIRYMVYGRENRFVRDLGQHDLERMSRDNCSELSDWRKLHESGQGILIHLADLGLTEAAPFPRQGRIQISFKLLSTTDPVTETIGSNSTANVLEQNPRRFTVALIRHNQLLRGDTKDIRFSFFNED